MNTNAVKGKDIQLSCLNYQNDTVIENIKIYDEPTNIDGFFAKSGFVSWMCGGKFYISSGWTNRGSSSIYAYTRSDNGEWIGNWEDSSIIDEIEKFENKQLFDCAIETADKFIKNGEQLFVSYEKFSFTDIVPGRNSNNGGDYGFYTTYYPTNVMGVYAVSTETSCDFDHCGTGFQGYEALTVSEYERLQKESDIVERQGSLYGVNQMYDSDIKKFAEIVDLIIKKGKNLFITDKEICFTDVVPGRKCNNGGEYGFYTSYYPTDIPGVYEVITDTSCDFDQCGTGFQGYKIITETLYARLKKRSDKIEEQGSLYNAPCYHNRDLREVKKEAELIVVNGGQLFVANEAIKFDDAIPGQEINFECQSICYPTEYPGVYEVYTDIGGESHGFSGYYALTVEEFNRLNIKSE